MSPLLTGNGNYAVFVLSIDDLEWTRHWLGTRRCDQVLVYVGRRDDVVPRIRIRAIESKSASATEPVDVRSTVRPFDEAVEQVVSTLDALWELIEGEGASRLVGDLRFSTFVEHLASTALSDLYPLEATRREDLFVLRAISEFSLERRLDDVVLDGVAVCTQYRAAVERKAIATTQRGATREWAVTLIRAGSGDVDHLVGGHGFTAALVIRSEEEASDVDIEGKTVDVQPEVAGEAKFRARGSVAGEGLDDEGDGSMTRGDDYAALAQDLYLACRHRGFRVAEPRVDALVIGPAIVAVSMEVEAGAAIRPIESATSDLAREVGVSTITVENDPDRPYHVRFLIARRERYFPPLPDEAAPVVAQDSQSYLGLYLGETLEGENYLSFVSSWPHLLVAGTTGSGKTTFLRSLLRQLNRVEPRHVQVVVVDGKGEVDYFGALDDAHYAPRFPEVLLGHSHAQEVLEWVVEEEIRRRRTIIVERAKREKGDRPKTARDLYVSALTGEGEQSPFPVLLVFIDEFAEIMLAGRGSVDARVALRLPTHHDSMTALGGKGAETLLGRGDLVFRSAGQAEIRLQGYS